MEALSGSRWLVTGAAGFIGSNLVEALLRADAEVVGLDNFSTGHRRNLDDVRDLVTPAQWRRFRMVEGDIRDDVACADAMRQVDLVLHQAALGSVPRSIAAPADSFQNNVSGFWTTLEAAREARVRRFIYASSSSVYGDSAELPKREDVVGRVLSPYAASKRMDEIAAESYAAAYGMTIVGLRYFNVFGPRQDPAGAYAAVIPRWMLALQRGEEAWINGDGMTSRDFCFVRNAVQANLKSARASLQPGHHVLNVAAGGRTTLVDLFALIREALAGLGVPCGTTEPSFRDFREGDIRHSLADISRARTLIDFSPTHDVREGIACTARWFVERDRA